MIEADGADVRPVRTVRGTGLPLRGDDIDTDQIIPARYLKATTFDGLGEYAFFDRRFDDDSTPTDHPFNRECYRDASVLVVNANFGCGSSREHAPQALKRWGIDALVGESFAEIFAGNCLALGMPTVTADRDAVVELQRRVEERPRAQLRVDLVEETVAVADFTASVSVDETQRNALVDGVWDTTALLMAHADSARRVAESLPYVELEA